MAKVEQISPPIADVVLNRVLYARFHLPVQFIGSVNGIHADTSKLGKVPMTYDSVGLKIKFEKRTVLVGWPNIHFVELAEGSTEPGTSR